MITGITALAGLKGSGKTHTAFTVAEEVKRSGTGVVPVVMSFADPIKMFLWDRFYIKKDQVDIDELKPRLDLDFDRANKCNLWGEMLSTLQEIADGATPIGPGYRKVIQLFGTDIMRTIDDNIWVKQTKKSLDELENCAYVSFHVILDDMRFANEYECLDRLAEWLECPFECYLLSPTPEGVYSSADDSHVSENLEWLIGLPHEVKVNPL